MQTAGSASETHGIRQSIPPKYVSSPLSPIKSSRQHFKLTQFQSYLKSARTQIQIWVPDNRAVYTVRCDKTDLLSRIVTERLDYKWHRKARRRRTGMALLNGQTERKIKLGPALAKRRMGVNWYRSIILKFGTKCRQTVLPTVFTTTPSPNCQSSVLSDTGKQPRDLWRPL
jgi:hypothetical protein